MSNEVQINTVHEFVRLFSIGLEAWVQAGEIAAAEIDKDASWPEKVNKENPLIPESAILDFAKLGRKVLIPQLLLAERPGHRALRKMPYELQKKYISEPVELLLAGGEPLLVDTANLTSDQAAQVLSPEGPRSLAAQRTLMESRIVNAGVPVGKADPDYEFKGKTVRVYRPCIIDLGELLRAGAQAI